MKDSNKYVSISKSKKRINAYHLSSTNDILKNDIVIEVDKYCINIKAAIIDDVKRYRPAFVDKYSRNFTFYTEYEIPPKRYLISEDSTEDEIIIDYYEQI
jgi:hypothetical protein